jgi:hypothetical protein
MHTHQGKKRAVHGSPNGLGEAVKPYQFEGAGKLIEDFWAEVEKTTGIEE